MQQDNPYEELLSPTTRRNRQTDRQNAITYIRNFCHENRLSQQYENQLIDRFILTQERNRANYWCEQQLEKKIISQLMISITNLIRLIESKGTIKLQVKNNQLDLICRINFPNSIGYNKYGIMQTKTLYQTMYMSFNHSKFTEANIQNKIQIMFQKLYDCLKFFLYRYQLNKQPIDQIDFLIFRKTDGRERKFDPILIGGLFTCCYRFFRVLFELFLSYSNLFLIPDLIKRTNAFCRRREKFVIKFSQFIDKKLDEIRKFQQSEQHYLEEWISKQMMGFKYEGLYNHFINKAPNSAQQIYESKNSIKLYRFQKNAFKIQNISTFFDETSTQQPQKYLIHAKGYFKKKQGNQENQTIQVQLEKLIAKNNQFGKNFSYNHQKLEQFDVLYAWNMMNSTFIHVQRSGQFIIIIKTQHQYEIQRVLKLFQNTFPQFSCETVQFAYILRANLGILNINIEELVSIPYFTGKLDLNAAKRRNQIISQRKKDLKKTLLMKIVRKRAGNNTSQFQNNQNPQRNNPFPINNRLNRNCNDRECKFAIYNFQDITIDQSNKTLRAIKFYITDKGQVKITNVKDFQSVNKQFNIIKNEIFKFINKDQIKQQQEKQRLQKQNELASMLITCKQTDKPYIQYGIYKRDWNHLHNATGRKVKTYKQAYSKDAAYYKTKTLKILTWNVWGERKKEDFLEYYNPSQKLQMDELDKQRFQCMINVIKEHDPDIVCLQQVYYLYKYNNDMFYQLLVKNLDNNYFFADYDPDTKDIPKGDLISNRTMILSKFPAQFTNLHCQYKNYWTNQRNYPYRENIRFKISILAEFNLKIQNEKKQLRVLVASVHLKSGDHDKDEKLRKFQFDFLDEIASQFDICILAGDFNTIEQPLCPYQKMSSIGKAIVDKKYYNFETALVSKDYSYKKGTYKPSIMDKILINFNTVNHKELRKKLQVQDIKFPGSFTMNHLSGQNYRLTYKDGLVRSLSDHIGRFVEFGFSK